MTIRKSLPVVLAWLGLFTSLVLASAIIWGYVTWQASLGQFAHSMADSVGAVSKAVERTAVTVESGQELLDQTGKMLVVTRNFVDALKVAAENQARIAPQYAEGLRNASTIGAKAGDMLQFVGNALETLVIPKGVAIEGLKPVLVFWQPLGQMGQKLTAMAPDIKAASANLEGISAAIERDGQSVSTTFIAASDQALTVLAEAAKTLERLKTQDTPEGIRDLKLTSENLRRISAQVDSAGNVGLALLVVGLLLAGWCFLNSLGALMLANSNAHGRVD